MQLLHDLQYAAVLAVIQVRKSETIGKETNVRILYRTEQPSTRRNVLVNNDAVPEEHLEWRTLNCSVVTAGGQTPRVDFRMIDASTGFSCR
jgi:hypothetical protein